MSCVPLTVRKLNACEFRIPDREHLESALVSERLASLPWTQPYKEVRGKAYFGCYHRTVVAVIPHLNGDQWHLGLQAKNFLVCSASLHWTQWIESSLPYMCRQLDCRWFQPKTARWYSSPFDGVIGNPLAPIRKARVRTKLDWQWKFAGLGSCVYFVKDTKEGLIKIGVSECLPNRFAALRSECRAPIKVLGVIQGNCVDEKLMHKRFARLRVKGEWFRPSRRLLTYIKDNAYQGLTERPVEVIENPFPPLIDARCLPVA